LRLGWKKSWRCADVRAAALALALPLAVAAAPQAGLSGRANELTLAGLRPGSDKMGPPAKLYRGLPLASQSDGVFLWGDECIHWELRVEVDEGGVVQVVTVDSSYAPDSKAKCPAPSSAAPRRKLLQTGHGLSPGDTRERVIELYGKPNSAGPSMRGSCELDLLYYAFDWAGTHVPQVMEVYCDHTTGRVVEITLAFPSL
jgi:hypothetical protein